MNYILDFKPSIVKVEEYILEDIEEKIRNKSSLEEYEVEYLLDNLVYNVRKRLNPKMDHFDNMCDTAQSMIFYYLKDLGVDVRACSTQRSITKNGVGHSFVVASFLVEGEPKIYLIDPTYIQFFKKEKCNIEAYVIYPGTPKLVLITPDPGYFIKRDDVDVVSELLNKGKIELDENSARIYGDSFLNTSTGGLLSDIKYQSIKGDVYIRSFLKGEERLSKTESELEGNGLLIKACNKLQVEESIDKKMA